MFSITNFDVSDIIDYWKAPLHWAARNGYKEKLKTLIAKYKAENNLDMRDHYYDDTALANAFVRNQYECAIMLLEAGAQPHARCGRDFTLLHSLIARGRLGLLRLLLWYDPAYEDIKNWQEKTAKQRIKEWAKRNAKNPKTAILSITDIIQTTANDAKAVKTHLAKAKDDLENKNYLSAAMHYKAIAGIFYHHYEMEQTLPFLQNEFYHLDREGRDRNPAIYETSKPILLKFYLNKAYHYYQAYEETYRQVEKSQLTAELQQQHLDILDRLIPLGGLLDKESEQKNYLSIASRLRHHQADEVCPKLESIDVSLKNLEEVESSSEKEHLLPKQDDTYSILDKPHKSLGLRKRAKSQATSAAESEDARFSPKF